MDIEKDVKACFFTAIKEEEKGKKHKGLLKVEPNIEEAKGYLKKAENNIELCHLMKNRNFDYKLPEEWYYTLYYCALAILAKYGVETRSQRCTALFLKYVKNKGFIEYDDEFIDRITVYKEKKETSDVDKREDARYGPAIDIPEVAENYDNMMKLCKEAISQAKEIVFSNEKHDVPGELLK
jgi:uncharacterized protein (UPF0332 family)